MAFGYWEKRKQTENLFLLNPTDGWGESICGLVERATGFEKCQSSYRDGKYCKAKTLQVNKMIINLIILLSAEVYFLVSI